MLMFRNCSPHQAQGLTPAAARLLLLLLLLLLRLHLPLATRDRWTAETVVWGPGIVGRQSARANAARRCSAAMRPGGARRRGAARERGAAMR